MHHSFDVHIAARHGIAAAILHNHFLFWIAKNKADGRHDHDGRSWTYCTRKGLRELFPYLGEGQIRAGIKKLLDAGVIRKGNYNKKGYDHTSWYAFEDEKSVFSAYPAHWLKQPIGWLKQPIDAAKTANRCGENSQPIPDNKQIKTDDKGISRKQGLSGQARSKVAQQDACRRLKRVGVDPGVAEAIVYEQRVDPADIRQAINNAMAKEFEARQSDLPWDLEPGYIIETLNTAVREGHSVSPSAAFRRMEEARKLRVRSSRPMRAQDFERNRQKQLAALGLAQ